MNGIVSVACIMSVFSYSFFYIYLLRLWTKPSCWVRVGGIACQYGVGWPIWLKGNVHYCGSSTPCLTNLPASSPPIIFVWALICLKVVLCDEFFMA